MTRVTEMAVEVVPRRRYRAAMTPPHLTGLGATAKTIEVIRLAEDQGYDDVWFGDAGGIDPLTLSAAALTATDRIRIGIAVVPAYTRTPAVLAATVATLADLSPDRFILGLGSSSEAMIKGWHGLDMDRPYTRIRETVTLLRSMLAGQKTAFDGEILRSNGYRQPAPAGAVPLYLAALGPRMIELAASAADGVILNLFPMPMLDDLVDQIHSAAQRSGRQCDDIEICARLQVLITNDAAAGRDAFRYAFTPYFTNQVYNRALAAAGYREQAAAVLRAGQARHWKTARAALDDDLVDSIAVIGDRDYCHQRIRDYVNAGVSTPILWCMSSDPAVRLETLRAFSPLEFSVDHE